MPQLPLIEGDDGPPVVGAASPCAQPFVALFPRGEGSAPHPPYPGVNRLAIPWDLKAGERLETSAGHDNLPTNSRGRGMKREGFPAQSALADLNRAGDPISPVRVGQAWVRFLAEASDHGPENFGTWDALMVLKHLATYLEDLIEMDAWADLWDVARGAGEVLIEPYEEDLADWHSCHPYASEWTRFATHGRTGSPPQDLTPEEARWMARFWPLTNLANQVIQFLWEREPTDGTAGEAAPTEVQA